MKFAFTFVTILLLFQSSIFAQIGVNDDNSAPDASAMLDVKSLDKGMLVPRMTTDQRTNDILNPATGLLVFDTDTGGFWFYNGVSWANLSSNDADTDPTNEYNTSIILNGTNLETVDGGGTIITQLSGLQDQDWLRTNGNIATSINNSIYTNGNVGIGTSSPSFPIDVQGTGGERIRTYTTDGLFAGYLSKNSTREFFAGIQADYETNDASSGYHIYDNTAGSQRFVIDKDGDVGIGQANPNAKLHVNGDFRLVDGTQGLGKLLTSNASGFASWTTITDNVDDADADPTNEIELPAVGISGQFLQTNGAGVSIWATPTDNVNDADADPSNEIELPAGGSDGQLLSTDGAGTYAWVSETAPDNLGNHIATNNMTLGTNYISNDGSASGIYIDADNNIGLNTSTPGAKLDVNGTIVAGASSTVNTPSLTGSEGIIMPGSTSDYLISVQDGNGRIQHKWNATIGTGETFITGGEDAAFIDLSVTSANDNDAWIQFKHANGASALAGDPISWNSQLMINQGGEVGINETSPDDMLHVTSGGNGTRVRAENSSNGWAGFVSKNTIGEMFIGVQGAFDANPGEFHFYDNVANVRRMVIDATGEVGIGKNNPSVKLDVNGSVNCTGGTCSSDVRWKKDIRPLEHALEKVLLMRGVSYDWKTADFPEKNFSADRQIGLIAQEVEAIFPELVKTDNEGFKSMDYMSFTAILLESVKSLKQENEEQDADNQAMQAELNQLKEKIASLEQQKDRIDRIEAMLTKGKLSINEVASAKK